MGEITIVTAFFDIGREKWTGFERDNSKYVEYFKFWARIKNKLIVYTDRKTADQVMQIRDRFGLKDRTQTVIIEDIITFDPEAYRRMEMALSNELAVKFRDQPTHPESYNALYDYVMYLKPFVIVDAGKRGLVDGMVAWLDFGFNHGGEFYMNPLDFDFLWEYDFSAKIHLFSVAELDDLPVFEIVRTMKTYITGAIIVAPLELWKDMQQLFRKAVFNLTGCGLMDDDQTLMIMACREQPDIFEIHPTENFFSPIKEFGGTHLTSICLKEYKRSKKRAQKLWKDRQYNQALKWYLRYAVDKLRSR